MRVVCISDTHSLHSQLCASFPIPDGDVLVHAGDFTETGHRDEVIAFNEFLGSLPHKYKIVIAGNHDTTFDRAMYPQNWQRFRDKKRFPHAQPFSPDEVRGLLTNALYLEDQAVVVEGFKFYGKWAFNLPRGEELLQKWQLIPNDTDVLITHAPPFGFLDHSTKNGNQGCEELVREVASRVKPQLHVFGHIHEGYGAVSNGATTFVNASACTVGGEAVNPAQAFELVTAKSRVSGAEGVLEYAVMYAQQLVRCAQKPAFEQMLTVEPMDSD